MPKFKVHVRRYVEEIGVVEIEADTAEDAANKYDERTYVVEWQAGDDILSHIGGVYSVTDENNDVIWEPL